MLSTIMAPVVHLRNFFELYDVYALTKEQVEEIKTKEKKIEEAFPEDHLV